MIAKNPLIIAGDKNISSRDLCSLDLHLRAFCIPAGQAAVSCTQARATQLQYLQSRVSPFVLTIWLLYNSSPTVLTLEKFSLQSCDGNVIMSWPSVSTVLIGPHAHHLSLGEVIKVSLLPLWCCAPFGHPWLHLQASRVSLVTENDLRIISKLTK